MHVKFCQANIDEQHIKAVLGASMKASRQHHYRKDRWLPSDPHLIRFVICSCVTKPIWFTRYLIDGLTVMDNNMARSHLYGGAKVLLENVNVLLRQLLVDMLLPVTSACYILLARHDDAHVGPSGSHIHLHEQAL